MKIEFSCFSWPGNGPSTQKDSLLAGDFLLVENPSPVVFNNTYEGNVVVAAVADGLEGTEKGEIAATKVLGVILEATAGSDSFDLDKTLEYGRQQLVKFETENHLSLGTTLAGIYFDKNGAIAFNVGDGRAYKLVKGFLNQITRDHSVNMGEIDHEDSEFFDWPANIVTSAIVGNGENFTVFRQTISAGNGDLFLVCTDGLWSKIAIEELEEAFSPGAPSQIAEKLLELSVPCADDNCSAVVIRILEK
ncbi:protein phosphatase 2C domain-containing protein [Erysipelotrichia bacterium]